jgi:ubiquinone/menaquinone biosynthesis C-methylase UbiE
MENDFYDVTEIPGDDISNEQLERNYHRYYWAGTFCTGKSVLEVACGSGQGLGYLAEIAEKFSAGDYSQKLLDIAKNHYGKRINLKKFDAQKMPFKDKTFDVIVFFEAMYYLPDAEKFISECRRVLKKAGRLLIATANKDLFDFNASPYTYKYYGIVEMNGLLSKYGFETEFFGNSPVSEVSMKQKILRPIKMIAAKTGLIPKTMKGKKLLKRLVFGKMIKMPNEIEAGKMEFIVPVKLDSSVPDTKHKVIYASALLKK